MVSGYWRRLAPSSWLAYDINDKSAAFRCVHTGTVGEFGACMCCSGTTFNGSEDEYSLDPPLREPTSQGRPHLLAFCRRFGGNLHSEKGVTAVLLALWLAPGGHHLLT